MRRNTFFKLLMGFLAGLIICGVGVGVFVMEITSLEVVGASDEVCRTEKDYTLPAGKKLYIGGRYADAETVTDETIPQGTIKMVAEHPENAKIDFWNIENMYLCETKAVYEDGEWDYDWDEDEEDSVVRHRVHGLCAPDINFTGDNDWNEFRKMLDHLKERKIYSPVEKTGLKVYINPADADKVVCLWKYEDRDVWLESAEVFDDDAADERESAAVSEATTAEETTAESVSETAVLTTAVPALPYYHLDKFGYK